jgi:hypothetical protein
MMLWKDNWKNENRDITFPRIFSFAKNQDITYEKAWAHYNDDIHEMFHLPLSIIAHDEMQKLQEEIQAITISNNNDEWKIPSGDYISTKKVYRNLSEQHHTPEQILNI